MEDERVVGGIPFPDDLLFHFFNNNTIIADTYIQDPVSTLKLYPKQSQAVKPDALSTGFSLPNSELDSIGKVEVCLHHKLADVENFGFIWASQNTSGPQYATTGLYLTSGKNGYSTMFKGSAAANCIILTSALEDDNTYILTSDFNAANITMKANKITIVNNEKIIGSDINGTTTAKGTETLTADIGVLSGRTNSAYVYSSKHKIFWIKFYNKSGELMHEFNFSEGYGVQTFDVVTKNAYTISNVNPTLFWNQKQDFNHYNFRYGFTLYQKSGSPDIRIPNDKLQNEIVPISIPSGYARIANYKECRKTFNQCESKFKLDDLTVNQDLVVTGAGDVALNGVYPLRGQYNGRNWYYDGKLSGISQWTHAFKWDGTQWVWSVNPGTILFYGVGDVQTPMECTSWIPAIGTLPVGAIANGGEKCTLSGTINPADYNGEYHEIGIWAGNKLFGKVGDEENKHIWKSGTPYDVYGWAIGAIDSQAHWYEYFNGDGNDDTPRPWNVISFAPFPMVGATGTGVLVESVSNDNDFYNADPDRVLFTEGTGVAKEISIGSMYSEIVDLVHDRGHLYINEDSDANFMLYKTGKGVDTSADLKIWAYVEK